jgi:hypothetical protein
VGDTHVGGAPNLADPGQGAPQEGPRGGVIELRQVAGDAVVAEVGLY